MPTFYALLIGLIPALVDASLKHSWKSLRTISPSPDLRQGSGKFWVGFGGTPDGMPFRFSSGLVVILSERQTADSFALLRNDKQRGVVKPRHLRWRAWFVLRSNLLRLL